jgi:uncharacterized Zn-binding protein involved in type VI secretion
MPGVARDGDTTGCGASLISGATKTYVNGRLIVRLGDGSSHGGVVVSGSSKVIVEGSPVARIGDSHSCPIPGHGVTVIVSGSDNVICG